jgi:hypothetical protein
LLPYLIADYEILAVACIVENLQPPYRAGKTDRATGWLTISIKDYKEFMPSLGRPRLISAREFFQHRRFRD